MRKRNTNLSATDFNTLEDFQTLVNTYEICNITELYKKFPYIGKKLFNLGFKDKIKFKEKVVVKKPRKYENYKIADDFQKYVDENGIKSVADFLEKNNGLYHWMASLGLSREIIYPDTEKRKKEKEEKLNQLPKTEKEFQEFIDVNEIVSSVDFVHRFSRVYNRLRELKLSDKIYYFGKRGEQKRFLEAFSDLKNFQDYISAHGFKSPIEFKKYNIKIYRRMIALKFWDKVYYGEEYDKRLQYLSTMSEYNSVEKIQEYVNTNNVRTRKELRDNHVTVYNHLLEVPNRDLIEFPDDRKIPTLEEIQDYIIENKIVSRVELKATSYLMYNTYLNIRKNTGKDVIFPKYSSVRSKQEMILMKELIRYGQINFSTQVMITDEETGNSYYYDCLLLKIGLLEVHGPQHFSNNIRPEWWSDRDEIENDKIKYKLAKKVGYNIYYIAYDSWKFYEKFDYFQKVYHSVKDLFDDLGIEVQENPNYEQDFMSLFSDDFVDLVNRICNGFEIHNQEELNKFDNLSWLVSEFNLYDKIIYYKEEEQDLQE